MTELQVDALPRDTRKRYAGRSKLVLTRPETTAVDGRYRGPR
jgi:hypothetical protein